MKALDLSRVKVVGFIPNFNPKCGYPEFAYNGVDTVSPASKYNFNTDSVKERISKPQAKHIKNAKRAFKKRNPNPTYTKGILDYQLEVGSGIVWRTN